MLFVPILLYQVVLRPSALPEGVSLQQFRVYLVCGDRRLIPNLVVVALLACF